MRYLLFLFIPLSLGAQSADSNRVTEALVTEMQQLRLAIERATLLSARTQLAISQLQLSESGVARVAQQYNDAHAAATAATLRRNQAALHVRNLEQQRTGTTDSQMTAELDQELKGMKVQLDDATANEQIQQTRESELNVQLQAAQNQISASRASIADMERMLDAAIQQLLKGK